MSLFVDLAFPVGVNKTFTYLVPAEFEGAARVGSRALAPFGKRTAVGFIVNVESSSPIKRLKSILDVIDEEPIISTELYDLTKWVSEYYFAPWGETLRTALPPGLTKKAKRYLVLKTRPDDRTLQSLPPQQSEILRQLLKKNRVSLSEVEKKITRTARAAVNALVEKGFVIVTEGRPRSTPAAKIERIIEITKESRSRWAGLKNDLESRASGKPPGGKRRAKELALLEALLKMPEESIPVRQASKVLGVSLSAIKSAAKRGIVSVTEREQIRRPTFEMYEAALGRRDITLTAHQQHASEEIDKAIRGGRFHTFLLHGVTGSGKTQVYIEAIRTVLSQGKSAIVLVPEISLTAQIVRRFQLHFGERVTVLHSRMSAGERYDSWRLTREGTYAVAIGPRSAVFAPMKNLGLVVVDEEQESSYKQFDQTPRYHARDVAIVRARNANAVVILGSATPSVESYYNAQQGKYTLLQLPERVDNAQMPEIEIVDMTAERKQKLDRFRQSRKEEFKQDPVAARMSKRTLELDSVSDLLKEKIEDRLAKKEGIILLQNRRGFAPFVECPDCGFVAMCDNCNVTLTYHIPKRHLQCHYCGFVQPAPDACPRCRGTDIRLRGVGTQRVEEDLKKLFPKSSSVRMDLDTTTRKGSHDVILRKFAEGEYDILLGTQMVAKGLDFSRVTLVGVISADTQMLLPDFRSAERVFQLLTQVAGRAGRTGALKGEVVIQTSQPQHYSLKHVVTHNFQEFYREELEYRRELDYPPYSRIALIEFRGENENEVMHHAESFARTLKAKNTHFLTLGPAAAAIPKLKSRYRWHTVIKNIKTKDPSGTHLQTVLTNALQIYRNSVLGKNRRVDIIIDIDPVGMM